MINYIKFIFTSLLKNRISQHILFWSLSYLVLVNILKVSAEIQRIDLIYTMVFHIPILLIVYVNLTLLFPLFLERGKYFIYGVLVVAIVASGSVFYIFLFDNWIDFIFTGYYFIAYYGFWDISLYMAVYVAGTSLLKLARGWFRLQEIEKEKTATELKALRSQINPHFLFNSLNSIYSLSRKSSPLVPETIIKLSGLMRYIIYEADVERVSLKKEIEMVKNYIELQQLRSSDATEINLKVDGDVANHKVAPLLFLPFIENSYKHGIKGGGKEVFVNIKFEISGCVLNFEVENSIGKSAVPTIKKWQGIGIENVRKRLELIYPAMHKLQVFNDKEKFRVLLQIQLT